MSKLIPQLEAADMLGICRQNLSVGRHGGTPMKKVKVKTCVFYLKSDIQALKEQRIRLKAERMALKGKRYHARAAEKEETNRLESRRSEALKKYRIVKLGHRYRVWYGMNLAAFCKNEADADDYVYMQLNKPGPRHPIFF